MSQTETIEQARSALHKLMNERVTNFDRGAVVYWAERGFYVMAADYKALEAEKAELVKALTPSEETKIRHWGEHTYLVDQLYIDEDGEEAEMTVKLVVPWTAVKEIMKSIVDHALTKDNSNE